LNLLQPKHPINTPSRKLFEKKGVKMKIFIDNLNMKKDFLNTNFQYLIILIITLTKMHLKTLAFILFIAFAAAVELR
jgi:hypothetical protein